MKTKANTFRLPLSKKFYTDICERVRTTLATVDLGQTGVSFYHVIEVINAYLTDGQEPDYSRSANVRLIFHLLRPEIDKAVSRSRRAREAAARRREAKTNADTNIAETNTDATAPETVVESTTPTAETNDVTAPETADHKLKPARNRNKNRNRKKHRHSRKK